jgi:hypothetical protein
MKEVIPDEDFKSIDRGVAADSSAVRERLAFVQSGKLDLDTAKEYLEYLLWNTSAVWQSCELQGKKQIQPRIFPNGLPRSKNGFGTPITSSFYSMLGMKYGKIQHGCLQGFTPIANKGHLANLA